jgi:hypothetical protein
MSGSEPWGLKVAVQVLRRGFRPLGSAATIRAAIFIPARGLLDYLPCASVRLCAEVIQEADMVRTSKLLLAATTLLAPALALAGSGNDPATTDPKKTTPVVTEHERSGDEAQSDLTQATARARVEHLKVGTDLATNGAVADNKDKIYPGQALYASISVEHIGAGSAVEAIWKGPEDKRMGSEVKKVTAGSSYLTFRAPDTAGWEPGEYRVEIRLGDELGGKEDFKILPKSGG